MKKYVIEKNNFQGFIVASLNNEGRCYYTEKTIEELQQEYESELIAVTDEELDLIIKEYENSLQKDWKEISEEYYFDALECLPPMNWRTIQPGVNVFCISEGYYGSLHSHYLKLSNSEGVKYYSALRCIYTTTNEQILEQIKNIKQDEKKPLHRFIARAIEMILNDIEKNGFASVFYPYNFVKDIKEYYGIDVKVDESLRIVYN